MDFSEIISVILGFVILLIVIFMVIPFLTMVFGAVFRLWNEEESFKNEKSNLKNNFKTFLIGIPLMAILLYFISTCN